MNNYFSIKDKIYDVTEKYPELIELFVNTGFTQLKNPAMRKLMGSTISVENALKTRHIDIESFEKQMIETIESGKADTGMLESRAKRNIEGTVRLEGLLPCPIRMQLLENLDAWIKDGHEEISYELQAASMGLDWLEEKVRASRSAEELADVYLSAGFSFFFDREHLGKYREAGVFKDISGIEKLNKDFDNEYISLKDPMGQYSIVGVVPAVFMVNTKLIGDRKIPSSWAELLKPEFEGGVAIPMNDLDMFNAILLGIYSKYGESGVAALGRSLMKSMHPAQMVKSSSQGGAEAPVITVMPYFFSLMGKQDGVMQAVWPEDGAIISPIFFLTKSESESKVKPLVDFLFSEHMGRVISAGGKFPSTNPKLDNGLAEGRKFIWPGWELIHNTDMAALIKRTEDIFYGRTQAAV